MGAKSYPVVGFTNNPRLMALETLKLGGILRPSPSLSVLQIG